MKKKKKPGGDQNQRQKTCLSFPEHLLCPTGEPFPLDLAPGYLPFQNSSQISPTVGTTMVVCIICLNLQFSIIKKK